MQCEDCGNRFEGARCGCGWSAKRGGAADKQEVPPQVNYCEWGQCGIPCSIGRMEGFHLPRYCPWHRELEHLDDPQERAAANTFARFQAWRKARVERSPIADQTVWDAMHGARKLTYRSVSR